MNERRWNSLDIGTRFVKFIDWPFIKRLPEFRTPPLRNKETTWLFQNSLTIGKRARFENPPKIHNYPLTHSCWFVNADWNKTTCSWHESGYQSKQNLEYTEQQLTTGAEEFAEFLDRHLLWIRSSKPLGFEDLKRPALPFHFPNGMCIWTPVVRWRFALFPAPLEPVVRWT